MIALLSLVPSLSSTAPISISHTFKSTQSGILTQRAFFDGSIVVGSTVACTGRSESQFVIAMLDISFIMRF